MPNNGEELSSSHHSANLDIIMRTAEQLAKMAIMAAETKRLLAALDDPESFEQAGRMYEQTYRTVPEVAGEALADYPEDMAYFGFSHDDLIVSLCNYKGEGEGEWELLTEELRKLPVYIDKNTSWFQVGA